VLLGHRFLAITERRGRRYPAGAHARQEPRWFGKGAGGQPAARLCAAEKRRARGPRAQRASST